MQLNVPEKIHFNQNPPISGPHHLPALAGPIQIPRRRVWRLVDSTNAKLIKTHRVNTPQNPPAAYLDFESFPSLCHPPRPKKLKPLSLSLSSTKATHSPAPRPHQNPHPPFGMSSFPYLILSYLFIFSILRSYIGSKIMVWIVHLTENVKNYKLKTYRDERILIYLWTRNKLLCKMNGKNIPKFNRTFYKLKCNLFTYQSISDRIYIL